MSHVPRTLRRRRREARLAREGVRGKPALLWLWLLRGGALRGGGTEGQVEEVHTLLFGGLMVGVGALHLHLLHIGEDGRDGLALFWYWYG